MGHPDQNEARAERQFDKDRRESKRKYSEKQCWGAKNWWHDWRHATDAPGWVLGDDCVRCQSCGLKAIASGMDDAQAPHHLQGTDGMKRPVVLDRIVDKVLAYRVPARTKKAKKRARKRRAQRVSCI